MGRLLGRVDKYQDGNQCIFHPHPLGYLWLFKKAGVLHSGKWRTAERVQGQASS